MEMILRSDKNGKGCIKTKLNRACLSYQMKSIWHAMRLSSCLYISTVSAYIILSLIHDDAIEYNKINSKYKYKMMAEDFILQMSWSENDAGTD
jgi:hypothetical protein